MEVWKATPLWKERAREIVGTFKLAQEQRVGAVSLCLVFSKGKQNKEKREKRMEAGGSLRSEETIPAAENHHQRSSHHCVYFVHKPGVAEEKSSQIRGEPDGSKQFLSALPSDQVFFYSVFWCSLEGTILFKLMHVHMTRCIR